MRLPGRCARFLRDHKKPGLFQRVWFFRQNFFLEEECLRAFKRLGLTVREFPVLEWDGLALSQLLTGLVEFQPDFLFSINHIGFDKGGWLAEFLRRAELPAAIWYVDNPDFIIRAYPENVSAWTCLFVWDRHYLKGLEDMGFPHLAYLPLAADERLFRPYRPPPREKFGAYKAAFVGSTWSERVEQQRARFADQGEKLAAIEAASRAFQKSRHYKAEPDLANVYPGFADLALPERIDLEAAVLWRASQRDRLEKVVSLSQAGVTVFGDPAWSNVLPGPAAYGGRLCYWRDLPAFYQCVEVNVNITSLQMKDGLNQRVFDVPATRSFLLTDDKESLWEIFTPAEMAVYRDLEEAQEKLAYFSRHPKARRRMAERAREKILSGHTYLHRIRAMVANMEDLFCSTKAADVPAPEAVREVLPLRRHSPL